MLTRHKGSSQPNHKSSSFTFLVASSCEDIGLRYHKWKFKSHCNENVASSQNLFIRAAANSYFIDQLICCLFSQLIK